MHPVPGIALLWYVENVQIIPNTSEIAAKTHGRTDITTYWGCFRNQKDDLIQTTHRNFIVYHHNINSLQLLLQVNIPVFNRKH